MLKIALCAALAVTTATCTFQAYLLHEVQARRELTVPVTCGAYDVKFVAHDNASWSDASYAALDVVHTRDCVLDIKRGRLNK